MGEVIHIHSRKFFSKEDAQNLLPTIRRVTERSFAEFSELQASLSYTPKGEPLYKKLVQKLDSVVTTWASKISYLGLEPAGLWLVNFESENGWFSWRLGDEELGFFTSRKSVSKNPFKPAELLT